MVTIKSSFSQKLIVGWNTLRQEGLVSLLKKVANFFWDKIYRQRNFVYFEYRLREKQIFSLPESDSIIVRRASVNDKLRIESELFPRLTGEQEYDKRYFSLLGQEGIECFVGEKDGRIIHYSWVFLKALESPLKDLPFEDIKLNDSYIGPVFTDPEARGIWIYPIVLMKILQYLKDSTKINRALLCVYGKNPAAVNFFKRLGFSTIN